MHINFSVPLFFETFGKTIEMHRQNIIDQKQIINSFCQAILLKGEQTPEDYQNYQKYKTNLQESIRQFKDDLNTLKTLSTEESILSRIESVITKIAVLDFLDQNRSLLSDAITSLEEAKLHFHDEEIPQGDTQEIVLENTLFDALHLHGADIPPERFIQASEMATDPTEAMVLMEKAASIYAERGDVGNCFSIRSTMVERFSIGEESPLFDVDKQIQELSLSQKSLPHEGIKVSGLDTGVLRHGAMTLQARTIDDRNKIQAICHLNHLSREKLEDTLRLISNHLPAFEEWLPSNLKGKVTIRKIDGGYQGSDEHGMFSEDLSKGLRMGYAVEVNIEGIGKIKIGEHHGHYSLYRRVIVEVNADQAPGTAINQIQGMLSMLGLGPTCFEARPEDEERKKIALLFRTYYPQAAYQLERSTPFYELSIEALKKIILQETPEMESIFDRYLSDPFSMTQTEVSPGFRVWNIPGLSNQLREAGAVGLMSGFSGMNEHLARVIVHGPRCSQERFESGQIIHGTSSVQDHFGGGAGYVFTRMLTAPMIEKTRAKEVEDDSPAAEEQVMESACQVELFPWSGTCQILYDLEVLERGGYAFLKDRYGSKIGEAYANRLNLIDFTQSLSMKHPGNEVMILEHIPPEYIKKILVRSEFSKANLIEQFERDGLTEIKDGQHFIKGYNGLPLEELIITGKAFKAEMWG